MHGTRQPGRGRERHRSDRDHRERPAQHAGVVLGQRDGRAGGGEHGQRRQHAPDVIGRDLPAQHDQHEREDERDREDDARVVRPLLEPDDESGERERRDRPGRDVSDARDDRTREVREVQQRRVEAVVVGVHDVARPPPVARERVIEREPEGGRREARDDREDACDERGLAPAEHGVDEREPPRLGPQRARHREQPGAPGRADAAGGGRDDERRVGHVGVAQRPAAPQHGQAEGEQRGQLRRRRRAEPARQRRRRGSAGEGAGQRDPLEHERGRAELRPEGGHTLLERLGHRVVERRVRRDTVPHGVARPDEMGVGVAAERLPGQCADEHRRQRRGGGDEDELPEPAHPPAVSASERRRKPPCSALRSEAQRATTAAA